jgi:hypothetical protein
LFAGAIGGVGYATCGAIPGPSSRSRLQWRLFFSLCRCGLGVWLGLLRVWLVLPVCLFACV